MREFCRTLLDAGHADELKKRKRQVEHVLKWYKDSHQKIAQMLKTETWLNSIESVLSEQDEALPNIFDSLDYNFSTKLHLYCVAEHLAKLILSCFCYGPSEAVSKYGLTLKPLNKSWFEFVTNVDPLFELLAAVLEKERCGQDIALYVLMQDRMIRNNLAHKGEVGICMSAIRAYNVLRRMLVLLVPEEEDRLPQFSYPDSLRFDFDAVLAHTDDPSYVFENFTTVLVVDSMHDIRRDHRELLANLPWNVVVDLDGYSSFGGLLDANKSFSVQKNLFTESVLRSAFVLNNSITYWFRCGDYMNYEFTKKANEQPLVLGKECFLSSKKEYFLEDMQDLFLEMLKKVSVVDRSVSILYMAEDEGPLESLVEAYKDRNSGMRDLSVIITAACYMSKQEIERMTARKRLAGDIFQLFQVTPQRFLEELFSRQKSLKLTLRSSSNTSGMLTLPGKNGSVELRQNDLISLSLYFEILHSGYPQRENAQQEQDEFYRGGIASWSAIDSGEVTNIIELGNMISDFKSLLGKTQDDGKKRVFVLRHVAGIGGTTLLRQIGWELHKDYAVLYANKYDYKVGDLLKYLYDKVLLTAPFVVLADDSLTGLEQLRDDIRGIERRCLLIVAARKDSAFANDNGEHARSVESIRDNKISILKEKFRQNSPLSEKDKAEKTERFEDFRAECGALTPFIIGLYYREKEFSISGYVERALRDIRETSTEMAMAMVALCGKYANKGLPLSLAKELVNMPQKKDFFSEKASTKVLAIKKRRGTSDELYQIHNLIGEKYLELYNHKYHNAEDERDMLYHLANTLIEKVYEGCRNSIKTDYLNLLIDLFVLYKTYEPNTQPADYSDFIEALGNQDSQRKIMEQLAVKFSGLIEEKGIVEVERGSPEQALFKLVAHVYGHLGRLYYKRRIDGGQNYVKASEALEKALRYNDIAMLEDASIYHMVGDSMYRALAMEWDNIQYSTDYKLSLADREKYEERITRASEYFDLSLSHGNWEKTPSYAFPDKIKLYMRYLEFVYKMRGIENQNDKRKLLSANERRFQSLLEELFEERDQYNLSAEAENKVSEFEDTYYSGLMFQNYGEAVEYLQNKYDNLVNNKNHTPSELDDAKRALVLARIRGLRAKAAGGDEGARNVFLTLSRHEADTLFTHIDSLIDRGITQTSYREKMRRTVLFHYWMQLAKVLDKPVQDGLRVARRWAELAKMERYARDPRPFYYMYALHCLAALDGTVDSIESARQTQNEIQSMLKENRFTPVHYNRKLIIDYLVADKTGMGRLFSCHGVNGNDIQSVLAAAQKYGRRLMVISGTMGREEKSVAFLSLYAPKEWVGIESEAAIGAADDNTLSSRTLSHKISFYGGFGYERIKAIPSAIWDTDMNEKPPLHNHPRRGRE